MTSTLRQLTPLLSLVTAIGLGCSDPATDDATGSTSSASGSTSTGTGGAGGAVDPLESAVKANDWVKLAGGPMVGGGAKQDDVFFLDAATGFAASGPKFQILKTTDGGATWSTSFSHTGTYFRAVVFLDPQHGFAGNLGAGLAPSIDDPTLIYETKDAGATWNPVTSITGATAKGLCNFTAIDANHIVGVGRANGPANMLVSNDAGATWEAKDLGSYFSMVIDAHFKTVDEGVIAGMDKATQHCTIMRTTDGGATFDPVFTSTTKGSLCWKLHFPSDNVGYAAVQDTAGGPGTFAKTVDGGATWTELPLPPLDPATKGYGAIGVGFINEDIGWMSAEDPKLPTYRTFDGGTTWEVDPVLTSPINRFRFVDAHTAYAIGAAVWKLTLP